MSTFRKEYRPLTDEEAELVDGIKTQAANQEYLIRRGFAGRESALALTKLEEAVMWAVKGVTG